MGDGTTRAQSGLAVQCAGYTSQPPENLPASIGFSSARCEGLEIERIAFAAHPSGGLWRQQYAAITRHEPLRSCRAIFYTDFTANPDSAGVCTLLSRLWTRFYKEVPPSHLLSEMRDYFDNKGQYEFLATWIPGLRQQARQEVGFIGAHVLQVPN
jgi:hypothetical protein